MSDVVVFGDVNLDWVVKGDLDLAWPDLRENGRTLLCEMAELAGGSGFNFASQATMRGMSTTLVGAVGEDVAGTVLQEAAGKQGVDARFFRKLHRTGCCFIARDNHDVRLLVNSRENANHHLSTEDIASVEDALNAARMIYVSGFCIRDPLAPRFKAVFPLLRGHLNQAGRAVIVLDVVPHRIYETYDWPEFKSLVSGVDVLISEVATMRRFLCLGDKEETIMENHARETLEALKPFFPAMILRYGPSGCDFEVRWHEALGVEEFCQTGHSQATSSDKRGYGDRLAAEVLNRWYFADKH